MINKENVKFLTQEELIICRNEYMKRWKNKHKDKVNAYARDYRKNKIPKIIELNKSIREKINLDVLA